MAHLNFKRIAYAAEIVVYLAVVSVVIYFVFIGFLFLIGFFPKDSPERVTRFETLIGGKVIQCERREDQARGTRSTAC